MSESTQHIGLAIVLAALAVGAIESAVHRTSSGEVAAVLSRLFQAACVLLIGCMPFASTLAYLAWCPDEWKDESLVLFWGASTVAVMIGSVAALCVLEGSLPSVDDDEEDGE